MSETHALCPPSCEVELGEPTHPDHERPLAPRGERACKLIAEHLRSKGIFADLVLCSSSKRTRETFELIAPAFGDHPDIRVEERLYQATASDLLARLREIARERPLGSCDRS